MASAADEGRTQEGDSPQATLQDPLQGGDLPARDRPVGHDLEVDSSETDSAMGSEVSSTLTSSVTSSVYDYRYEHGRRYHAHSDGAYYLPNDEPEADRLDLQHEIWRVALNRALYLAPVPQPAENVLDIGTGTGIWAIEYADEHPDSHIIGTDLSPIQPTWVPPNCKFEVSNAEAPWTFDKKFDFIHSRLLVLGVHDWPRLLQQCFDHLKPGGWLEVQEFTFPLYCDDKSASDDNPFMAWGRRMHEAALKAGLVLNAPIHFNEYLHDIGFANIREETAKLPLGPWAKGKKEKVLGHYMLENLYTGAQGASLALFTRLLGWTREAVEVDLIEVRREMKKTSNHIYSNMYVHYCQKPAAAKSATEDEDHE